MRLRCIFPLNEELARPVVGKDAAFFLNRYFDKAYEAAITRDIEKKRKRVLGFLTTIEDDIGELSAVEVDRLKKRLVKPIMDKRRMRIERQNATAEAIGTKLKAALDKSNTVEETDKIDAEYKGYYGDYHRHRLRIEQEYLEELEDAVTRVYASLEQFRWMHRTTQKPMHLRREESFNYSIHMAVEEPYFVDLCEAKKIDYQKEWAVLKEWLRQNQHRVFPNEPRVKYYDPKSGHNTRAYNTVLTTLTNMFRKFRNEEAYKKGRTYLLRKKREWEALLKKKNESHLELDYL